MNKKDSDTVKQLITGLEDIEVPQDEDIDSIRHQTMDALVLAEVYLKQTIEGNSSGHYWANLVNSRAEELIDAFRDYVENLEEQDDEAEGSSEEADSDSELPLEEWESAMEALLTLTPPIKFDATPELAKEYAVNIKRHVQSVSDRTKAIQERLNSYETRQDNLEKKQDGIEESAESFFENAGSRLEAAESEILKDLRAVVETNHNRWYEEYLEQSNADFDVVKTYTEDAVDRLLETNGEDLTNRVADIETSVKEARAKVDGVIEGANSSFQEAFRRYQAEHEKLSGSTSAQYTVLLKQLKKDVESSGRTVAALAGQSMADGFEKQGKTAERTVWIWQVIAIALVGGIVAYSASIPESIPNNTVELTTFILRRTLIYTAMTFGFFIARSAIKRYSAIADTNNRLHLELLALEPFIRALEEEEAKKLRARVATSTFGHALVEDRQKLGEMLVKVFGKRQEEKSETGEVEDLEEDITLRGNGVKPEPAA